MSAIGKIGNNFQTKIRGLCVDIVKTGTGTKTEHDFNRHAQIIKKFVNDGLINGGKLPDGRRVQRYVAGNKDVYNIFYAPNKTRMPDVTYEVSPNESSILTERLKYFQRGMDLVKNLFRK